jgi:hypothetical protein
MLDDIATAIEARAARLRANAEQADKHEDCLDEMTTATQEELRQLVAKAGDLLCNLHLARKGQYGDDN